MNFNKIGILEIDGERMGFRPIAIECDNTSLFTPIKGELFELLPMSERIKIDCPIKNVIFNDPATIVIWDDGTKTVVKCQPGDTYDAEKGLALCISKKFFDNKGNFNEVFKKWVPETLEVKEKDSDIEPYTGLKYGTRIYIDTTENGCRGAERRVGYITKETSRGGMLKSDPGYNVHTEDGYIWRIVPNSKIEILK